jgi:hypothetical protein
MAQDAPELNVNHRPVRASIQVVVNMLMLLKQPAGFVLSGGSLCALIAEPVPTPSSIDCMRHALIGMGLSISEEDRVMIVRDGHDQLEEQELEHVVPRYSPPPSTMSGEGAVLDGIVAQEMDRLDAYINSILIGDSSH